MQQSGRLLATFRRLLSSLAMLSVTDTSIVRTVELSVIDSHAISSPLGTLVLSTLTLSIVMFSMTETMHGTVIRFRGIFDLLTDVPRELQVEFPYHSLSSRRELQLIRG